VADAAFASKNGNGKTEMSSRDEMKTLLDTNHKWPSEYKFKFIVPLDQVERMRELLHGDIADERPSSSGRFTSFSLTKTMPSSDAVLDVYDKVRGVPGLVSL
jgi:uncharacterized protein